MPKLNISVLQEDVQAALDAMRPFVEDSSDIGPREFQGFLSVVRRAVLRRQFDSLAGPIIARAQSASESVTRALYAPRPSSFRGQRRELGGL